MGVLLPFYSIISFIIYSNRKRGVNLEMSLKKATGIKEDITAIPNFQFYLFCIMYLSNKIE